MPRRNRRRCGNTDPAVFTKLSNELSEAWIVKTRYRGSWADYKADKKSGAIGERVRAQRPEAGDRARRVGMDDARAVLARYIAA